MMQEQMDNAVGELRSYTFRLKPSTAIQVWLHELDKDQRGQLGYKVETIFRLPVDNSADGYGSPTKGQSLTLAPDDGEFDVMAPEGAMVQMMVAAVSPEGVPSKWDLTVFVAGDTVQPDAPAVIMVDVGPIGAEATVDLSCEDDCACQDKQPGEIPHLKVVGSREDDNEIVEIDPDASIPFPGEADNTPPRAI